MELVPALPHSISGNSHSNLEYSPPAALRDAAILLGAAPQLKSVEPNPALPNDVSGVRHKSAATAHFADILGQTLAGPLFATWSPTADIIATNKPTSTNSTVTALDTNGRRDGRKRSRR